MTKRADKRYTATARIDGKKIFGYGSTQAAAKADLARKVARLKAGLPVRDSSRTVGDWLTEWRTTMLEASDRATFTKALYAGLTTSHVDPVIGSIPLGKLKPTDITRLILAMQANGSAASTIRNAYAALRGALDDAVRNDLIATNPAVKVRRPKVSQQEAPNLTLEQVGRLLAAPATRYTPALRLILMTGLRRGELLSVKWSDVDLERREMRVSGSLVRQDGCLVVSDTKTARSRRTVSLSDPSVTLLKSLKATQNAERLRAANLWDDTGYVFTTEFGKPVDPRNLLRTVELAAGAAGLSEAIGAHTLRHTYATVGLLNGVPIHVVSRNLGHSSIAITADTYGHLTDAASQLAADTVSAAMGM